MATKQQVIELHRKHPAWGPSEIARALDCESSYVRATGQRNGLIFPRSRSSLEHAIAAERERCAKIAERRASICDDACQKIKAGKLYQGVPSAFETENCARLEAEHIARLIRGEADFWPERARGN